MTEFTLNDKMAGSEVWIILAVRRNVQSFDGDADSGGVRAVFVGRVAAVHAAVVGGRAQHGQPRVSE